MNNLIGAEPWELRGANDARIRALEVWLQRYYSTVGKATNQAITSGVVATINFDGTPIEDQPLYAAGSDTWTIPAAGLWELCLTVTYIHSVNTGEDCSALWNVDGVVYEGTRSSRPVNSGMAAINFITLPLNAGQVVTPQAYASATLPIILGDGNPHKYTRAHIRRVGPHP